MRIESINNSKVKEWAKLKEKKFRDQSGLFLIEGDHLLNEAKNTGLIKEVIATDSSFEIKGLPFYEVTELVMKKISNQISIPKVIAIVQKLQPREIKGKVCMLDNIQDPGNLGTIIRSCVAFGIDTIILSNDTVDLYNEKVIRATEGMLFKMNFIKSSLDEYISYLKKLNYKIYGTNVKSGKNLKEINFSENCAVIIGNEGNGISQKISTLCEDHIYIPIKNCESLNAAVAASIIFYEISR